MRKGGMPIPPQDWDGQSVCRITMCVPDTVWWRTTVYSKLYELVRGENWDGRWGRIVDAQSIGWQICESICMDCNFQHHQQVQLSLIKHLVAALTDRKIHHDQWYLDNDPQSTVGEVEIDKSALIANGNIRDWGLADAVSEVFSKGFIDLDLPTGTTTIQDDIQGMNEHLETLHNRFMVDGWLFDQNIAEVLNNTLRVNGNFPNLEQLSGQWSIADMMRMYYSDPDDQQGEASIFRNIYQRLAPSNDKDIYTALDNLELRVTNNVQTDLTGVENGLAGINQTLLNLIDALQDCCAKSDDPSEITRALDKIQAAIQAMEIVQINADETARVFYKSSPCGCGGDVQGLIDGAGGSNNGGEIPDTLPYVPGPILKDCEPVNVIQFIEWIRDLLQALDDFLSSYELVNLTIDTVLDVVGDALWVRAGLLEVVNEAVGGPGTPEESVTRPIQAALVIAGSIAKLGPLNILNILELMIDYIRYDFDVWKQLDCNQYQIKIDILDFLPLRFGEFLKGKGLSTVLVNDGRDLLRSLLKTRFGKELL